MQILNVDYRPNGNIRYQLDAHATERSSASTVTVVERAGSGAPFYCSTCLLNKCQHIRYVQQEIAA